MTASSHPHTQTPPQWGVIRIVDFRPRYLSPLGDWGRSVEQAAVFDTMDAARRAAGEVRGLVCRVDPEPTYGTH